jgi:hypothetical protein
MSLQKFNFHNVSYYHIPTEESYPYLSATQRCVKKYNREGKISYWYLILKYVLENPNQRNVDIRKALNMGKTGRENRFQELIENRLIVNVSTRFKRSSYVATTDGLLRYLGVMDL